MDVVPSYMRCPQAPTSHVNDSENDLRFLVGIDDERGTTLYIECFRVTCVV